MKFHLCVYFPYLVLVMCTEHVYSVNFLCVDHPKMKIVPSLCLELPGKEACMPRPEGGTFEIDWQLLSPVTPVTTTVKIVLDISRL